MIACNKWSPHPDELYTERKKVIRFFEEHHPETFDLYGETGESVAGKRRLAPFEIDV